MKQVKTVLMATGASAAVCLSAHFWDEEYGGSIEFALFNWALISVALYLVIAGHETRAKPSN